MTEYFELIHNHSIIVLFVLSVLSKILLTPSIIESKYYRLSSSIVIMTVVWLFIIQTTTISSLAIPVLAMITIYILQSSLTRMSFEKTMYLPLLAFFLSDFDLQNITLIKFLTYAEIFFFIQCHLSMARDSELWRKNILFTISIFLAMGIYFLDTNSAALQQLSLFIILVVYACRTLGVLSTKLSNGVFQSTTSLIFFLMLLRVIDHTVAYDIYSVLLFKVIKVSIIIFATIRFIAFLSLKQKSSSQTLSAYLDLSVVWLLLFFRDINNYEFTLAWLIFFMPLYLLSLVEKHESFNKLQLPLLFLAMPFTSWFYSPLFKSINQSEIGLFAILGLAYSLIIMVQLRDRINFIIKTFLSPKLTS